MNEMENKAFKLVYAFLDKWRGTIIETQEQWLQLGADVGQLGRDLDIDHNQLGFNLMEAALDYLTFLYQDGKKPMPAGYLGRDDI